MVYLAGWWVAVLGGVRRDQLMFSGVGGIVNLLSSWKRLMQKFLCEKKIPKPKITCFFITSGRGSTRTLNLFQGYILWPPKKKFPPPPLKIFEIFPFFADFFGGHKDLYLNKDIFPLFTTFLFPSFLPFSLLFSTFFFFSSLFPSFFLFPRSSL